ncbi:50S ribosomal protein L18e [Candidatus Woesearchaeota archaeon]|nr:50S ribosomal protein L18e [Candidatus Woesearchaeota archaeon]
MRRTGPTNIQLQKLIEALKKKAIVENVPLWRRVAYELERPTRQRRIVNLARINRYTKENEIILVPGKVLAQGALDHSVTVAAYNFSGNAKEKITQSKGKAVALWDFVQSNPQPKDIKIIG